MIPTSQVYEYDLHWVIWNLRVNDVGDGLLWESTLQKSQDYPKSLNRMHCGPERDGRNVRTCPGEQKDF